MIDVINKISLGEYKTWEKSIKYWAETVLKEEGVSGSLSISIVEPEEIKKQNGFFRNIREVTDVLSFPSDDEEYLGDIMICYQRACEQAEEYGHSVKREMSFLVIHGVLHLLGYDHIEKEDEKEMFSRQKDILDVLEIER